MDAWARKKKLDNMSFDFEELEFMLAELIESSFELQQSDYSTPINLSFTIKFDREGIPRIESFRKAQLTFHKHKAPPAPLSTMQENDAEYFITLDLAGYAIEEIEVFAEQKAITILSRKSKPFYKKFFFNWPIQQGTLQKSFKNNVLELVIKKNPQIQPLP